MSHSLLYGSLGVTAIAVSVLWCFAKNRTFPSRSYLYFVITTLCMFIMVVIRERATLFQDDVKLLCVASLGTAALTSFVQYLAASKRERVQAGTPIASRS